MLNNISLGKFRRKWNGKMTKKFEFNWQIPVPEPLLAGCVFDRWTEEKDNTDLELACTFKVDEYGFFIYWKSEGRVRSFDVYHLD